MPYYRDSCSFRLSDHPKHFKRPLGRKMEEMQFNSWSLGFNFLGSGGAEL